MVFQLLNQYDLCPYDLNVIISAFLFIDRVYFVIDVVVIIIIVMMVIVDGGCLVRPYSSIHLQ